MRFHIEGIADAVSTRVRETLQAPGYGHPVHRELAPSYGPCRQCLRTFVIGQEERLLFTYQPFREPGSLPAPGPVFIHAATCQRYSAGTLPDDFKTLPLVFEAYRHGGHLIEQARIGTGASDAMLMSLMERTGADYVHIRNGEAGCFMARATPAA